MHRSGAGPRDGASTPTTPTSDDVELERLKALLDAEHVTLENVERRLHRRKVKANWGKFAQWVSLEVLAPVKVYRPYIGVLREITSFLQWEVAVAAQWRKEGLKKVISLSQRVQRLEDRRDDPQGQQNVPDSPPGRSAGSSSDEL